MDILLRKNAVVIIAAISLPLLFIPACTEPHEHTARAINPEDSASIMVSYGVNTLISDSGVIKYRIVTERWEVNNMKQPPRWEFMKGIFFEQFDEQFHVQGYIQADTAWYFDQQKLWKLRGRVRICNMNGLYYRSEELYWDGIRHEFYFSALAGLTLEPGFLFYYQAGHNDSGLSPKYLKMHYLSVPVDIKYTFGLTGSATASVFTGPVANIGIIGNLFEKGAFVTTKDLTDPMHQLTRVNVQWNFGVAFTIAEAVQLRVGYALGMSRLLVPEQELHNNTFTVGAGLLF